MQITSRIKSRSSALSTAEVRVSVIAPLMLESGTIISSYMNCWMFNTYNDNPFLQRHVYKYLHN